MLHMKYEITHVHLRSLKDVDDMSDFPTPVRTAAMKFAEIVDEVGKRLHIGCVLAAGQDWVEVSLPEQADLKPRMLVRFLPSSIAHEVKVEQRGEDRIGFTYSRGGPPEDPFAGLPGLQDPHTAAVRYRR